MRRTPTRVLLVLGAIVVALVLLWLVFGPLVTLYGGADLRKPGADPLAARNSVVALFGSFLGFAVAAVTCFFGGRKYFAERAKQDLDRFGAAARDLSSDDEMLRAGGALTLDGILHEAPAHRNRALRHLTAFLRHQTRDGGDPDRVDVSAVLDALRNRGRPPARYPDLPLDLHGIRLPGADLAGIDLNHADLTGAELAGANLNGAALSHTNLCHAVLTGADLTGADLSHADATNARLADATVTAANLDGATLTGTTLTAR